MSDVDNNLFVIEFDDSDYSTSNNKTYLDFRLKGLSEDYYGLFDKLSRISDIDIENDIDFFKECEIKAISIEIHHSGTIDDIESLIGEVKMTPIEISIDIQSEEILLDISNTEVYIDEDMQDILDKIK